LLTSMPMLTGWEAVHVFRGINGFETTFRIDLRREGQLDKNAVHIVIRVEVADKLQHVVS